MVREHILVTGGCGYVGSCLVPVLLNNDYAVTVVDAMWFGNHLPAHPHLNVLREDIRNIDEIALDGIDRIIHLASVANDPCAELDPKLSWEVNVMGTLQLVEKAVKSGVKQFVYASSGSVYGIKEEAQVTEDLPLKPISEYNKTKMVAERILLSYQHEIALQCIRPATVCGLSPRMRLDVSVNMLTMQALTKGRITVFGGNQVRPNIHIDDMVNVYMHFLGPCSRQTGIFNAGFENISILEIAKRVTDLVPAEIVVTASNDPRSYRLNSDKLIGTGFQLQKQVKNAIEEIFHAYRRGDLVDNKSHYNVKWMRETVVN
jgi:nucleoside-diphosphate-sugar epimerase